MRCMMLQCCWVHVFLGLLRRLILYIDAHVDNTSCSLVLRAPAVETKCRYRHLFLDLQLQKQSTEFGSPQYYHNICKAITSGFFMQVRAIQSANVANPCNVFH